MINETMTPLVYKPEELIRILGISRNTVYELLRSGRIRSIKVGTRYLVPHDALEVFLNVKETENQEK